MSQVDNIFILVRARLQELSIKLWLEPYYYEEIGPIEHEIDKLATDFSQHLSIPYIKCRAAISELQDGALRKLAARKEFEDTGVATFTVRRVTNQQGTQNIVEVKCPLNALGAELSSRIANKLELQPEDHLKCIAAGKILDSEKNLQEQNLKNNQVLMVLVSEARDSNGPSSDAMYDRIRKIKADIEAVVDSSRQLVEMEDQDGNPIFLPPAENRALLIALGYCEKARASIKRQHYDEALILLLEADEKFTACNSKFLEIVDNYALVNLDIVWCYLCLKNLTQLPDAERRLDICERNFHRSYGQNFQRLFALKGKACPERALIMRLHLLQGIVFFHQNRRDEAYEKLEEATNELRDLKVDEEGLQTLVEMGYEPYEARMALREATNNLERAVQIIHERRERVNETRERSERDRAENQRLNARRRRDKDWVHPRGVTALMEMGFPRNLVVAALKKSKNDLTRAVDLLQNSPDELRAVVSPTQSADSLLMQQLQQLGFNADLARIALETMKNNLDKSIDFLVRMYENEEDLMAAMQRMTETISQTEAERGSGATSLPDVVADSADIPSTSRQANNTLLEMAIKKFEEEKETLRAYKRFQTGLSDNEYDYLDLPLVQEEQFLIDYKRLLEQ